MTMTTATTQPQQPETGERDRNFVAIGFLNGLWAPSSDDLKRLEDHLNGLVDTDGLRTLAGVAVRYYQEPEIVDGYRRVLDDEAAAGLALDLGIITGINESGEIVQGSRGAIEPARIGGAIVLTAFGKNPWIVEPEAAGA